MGYEDRIRSGPTIIAHCMTCSCASATGQWKPDRPTAMGDALMYGRKLGRGSMKSFHSWPGRVTFIAQVKSIKYHDSCLPSLALLPCSF